MNADCRGWLDDGSSEAIIGIILNALTLVWQLIDRRKINKANAELKETIEANSNALAH